MKYNVMYRRGDRVEPASYLHGRTFETEEGARESMVASIHEGARKYYSVQPIVEEKPEVKLNPKRANARTRLPLHLCPPTLIIEVARVMDFCGEKSDPTRYAYNWRDSETSLTDYIDAMKRHIAALEDGEWLDPKSGRPHVAHIASSCGIVLDSEKAGTLVKDTPEKSCGVAQQLRDYEQEQLSKQEPSGEAASHEAGPWKIKYKSLTDPTIVQDSVDLPIVYHSLEAASKAAADWTASVGRGNGLWYAEKVT